MNTFKITFTDGAVIEVKAFNYSCAKIVAQFQRLMSQKMEGHRADFIVDEDRSQMIKGK